MELTPRKQSILSFIVKNYIETGEPVGSKAICEDPRFGISSATVRNEMSDLVSMGLLSQPHTSAGRVPTGAGLSFYVSNLMGEYSLTKNDCELLDSLVNKCVSNIDKAFYNAARVLSDITGCAAVSLTAPDENVCVRKIELISMGPRTALMVLVTSSGMVRSKLCRFDLPIPIDSVAYFTNFADECLAGLEIRNFTPAMVQTLAARAGEHALEITPLLFSAAELITESGEADFCIEGGTNLLISSDFSPAKAREVLGAVSRSDRMLSLFKSLNNKVGVIFGSDTEIDALDRSSMVVAKCEIGCARSGYIGIVGPTRMDYIHIIPSIGYFADSLQAVLADRLEELRGSE